jgi:hypothetical protein
MLLYITGDINLHKCPKCHTLHNNFTNIAEDPMHLATAVSSTIHAEHRLEGGGGTMFV